MSQKNQHEPTVPAPVASAETSANAQTPPTVTLTEAEHAQLKADAAKAAEHWDKFLRASADFDNYRKRITREKEDLTRAARESVIASLLPALDNLERALDHSPEGTPLHEGLLQVQKQFERSLAEFGLAEITAKPGDPFNPNLHEAISHTESNDQPDGAVLQPIQSGYKLGDKLLRPARVIVSKTPEDAASAAPAAPSPAADKKNSWFKSPFAK